MREGKDGLRLTSNSCCGFWAREGKGGRDWGEQGRAKEGGRGWRGKGSEGKPEEAREIGWSIVGKNGSADCAKQAVDRILSYLKKKQCGEENNYYFMAMEQL